MRQGQLEERYRAWQGTSDVWEHLSLIITRRLHYYNGLLINNLPLVHVKDVTLTPSMHISLYWTANFHLLPLLDMLHSTGLNKKKDSKHLISHAVGFLTKLGAICGYDVSREWWVNSKFYVHIICINILAIGDCASIQLLTPLVVICLPKTPKRDPATEISNLWLQSTRSYKGRVVGFFPTTLCCS